MEFTVNIKPFEFSLCDEEIDALMERGYKFDRNNPEEVAKAFNEFIRYNISGILDEWASVNLGNEDR